MKVATSVVIYPDDTTEYGVMGRYNERAEAIICRVDVDRVTAVQTNGWQEMQRFADALAKAAELGRLAEAARESEQAATVQAVA